MNGILKIIISISTLVFITGIIDLFLYKSKHSAQIKNILILIIILVTVFNFSKLNLWDISIFDVKNFEISEEEIWKSTSKTLEQEFEKQILDYCHHNNLSIESCKVTINTNFSEFNIDSVTIIGSDATVAKNLIVGHYNLNPAYINISGEKSR